MVNFIHEWIFLSIHQQYKIQYHQSADKLWKIYQRLSILLDKLPRVWGRSVVWNSAVSQPSYKFWMCNACRLMRILRSSLLQPRWMSRPASSFPLAGGHYPGRKKSMSKSKNKRKREVDVKKKIHITNKKFDRMRERRRLKESLPWSGRPMPIKINTYNKITTQQHLYVRVVNKFTAPYICIIITCTQGPSLCRYFIRTNNHYRVVLEIS